MKIVLTNFGSTGDFQPLIALAHQLVRDGEQVLFAVPAFAESAIRSAGFECMSIGPDLSFVRDQANQVLGESCGDEGSQTSLFELLSPLREHLPQFLDGLSSACRGADLLIGGGAQPLARMVHELDGIAFVSVQLCHFGGSGGPELRDTGDRIINDFRRSAGLAAIQDTLTSGCNSPLLALYAMSTHLLSKSTLRPNHHHLTGFFFPSEPCELDPDMERFLAAGDAPVIVALGSMLPDRNEALREAITEGILLSGRRGILQGFGDNLPRVSNPCIHFTEWIPHSLVFPRASCVLCHGGAGTSAQVFRAGISGIFMPFGDFFDQRYWAQIAFEAGCSVPQIPYATLTPTVLADAISQTLSRSKLRDAARVLGTKIRSERGVSNASRLIHELAASIGVD